MAATLKSNEVQPRISKLNHLAHFQKRLLQPEIVNEDNVELIMNAMLQ
jgi:hypothetical protein